MHRVQAPSAGGSNEFLRPLVWTVSPIETALGLAAGERGATGDDGLDPATFQVCTEIGRHLLLAQFEYSSWIMRRVEKVRFENESRLSRDNSLEFLVPEYAPVLRVPHLGGGVGPRSMYLVPLSVMRRRTLVNLQLRDEQGSSISMLGLRFTQKLDQAMLRAAAALSTGSGDGVVPSDVERLIADIICGEREVVEAATERELRWRKYGVNQDYFSEDDVFGVVLSRLRHNFTLYVLLPVDEGRHRRLSLTFDEPISWKYQKPRLQEPVGDEPVAYAPFASERSWKALGWTRLGIRPTRLRFLTPGAENCASYHFEFTAPPGLRITRARLLAGRPNRQPTTAGLDRHTPGRRATKIQTDCNDDDSYAAGLHATEVPNGSLSRAQVHLQITRPGWLTTLTIACWACLAVLGLVGSHLWATDQTPSQLEDKELGAVVGLMAAVSAGAATYVAHSGGHPVSEKMLTWLRGVGTVAVLLPAAAAMLLVFASKEGLALTIPWVSRYFDPPWWVRIWAAVFLALLLAAIVTATWTAVWISEKRRGRLSRWDMSGILAHTRRKPLLGHLPADRQHDFFQVAKALGFDRWAVGVISAEGWHEAYAWTDDRQRAAVQQLRTLRGSGRQTPTGCRCAHAPGTEAPGAGTPPVPHRHCANHVEEAPTRSQS